MVEETSESIKYFEKPAYVVIYILLGIAFFIFGFINMGFTRSHFYLYQWIIGIAFIAMAIWYKSNPIFVIAESKIVINPAPAKPKREIHFSDIKRIDEKSITKVSLIVDNGGMEDYVKLPLGAIAKENRARLIAYLKERSKTEAA